MLCMPIGAANASAFMHDVALGSGDKRAPPHNLVLPSPLVFAGAFARRNQTTSTSNPRHPLRKLQKVRAHEPLSDAFDPRKGGLSLPTWLQCVQKPLCSRRCSTLTSYHPFLSTITGSYLLIYPRKPMHLCQSPNNNSNHHHHHRRHLQ
jgi:hypothetical protein